ncbi:MAG: GMC family oxidoreductase [Longispora sp.]|nr:GMC family oxidoreductase [Longispora sp. (in: high G+C Gram-positive bacteria)]
MAHFDVVVIGSGFGGSVSALRLVEKGYKVAVLEAGRRFADDEFPKTSWRLRSFLWAPGLRCFGIQRINLLRDALILSGAGVGGGSLVYANTLYEPLPQFFADKQWAHITDWADELAPHYNQAKRMLGVVTYGRLTSADLVMRKVAEDMGVGHTFRSTPVGVYFGKPDTDPYFGGVGPKRSPCIECGACMTGCRYNAKNTLVKNYLYLAEQTGAEVFPLTTVTSVEPDGESYIITTRRTGGLRKRVFTADQVIFAAGALGTQRLLHKMKSSRMLPYLSNKLGALTRTNSESVLGARTLSKDVDFTDGVAITSSFHPDEYTHIEPVRYGKGSNSMALLQTVLTDGDSRWPRWMMGIGAFFKDPKFIRYMSVRRWSERSIIALVMQSRDNSLIVRSKRAWYGRRKLTSRQGHGEPSPTWIPAGNEAVRRMADELGGRAGGTWNELFNIPLTAHILGGCAIGDSRETGVIDPYHRVYGHPGLHIVDGAAVSANLGVNPSLTITAQAERALAMWPNKGERDSRPALGSAYQRVAVVTPKSPVVPVNAPAALRR